MGKIKKYVNILAVMAILLLLAIGLVSNYSYIFSRHVVGVVENVERINLNVSLLQGGVEANEKLNRELFSFAVAIKEASGEIVTASAEDRQWAVVKPGQCAESIYYPYPPWDLKKSGTFYGARLLKLSDCNPK